MYLKLHSIASPTPDANILLSVRFAGAAGSQRKSLRALWLFVGSKLTDNGRWFMRVAINEN
jgi:hypothetical protein